MDASTGASNYTGYVVAAAVVIIAIVIYYKIVNSPLVKAAGALGGVTAKVSELGKLDGIGRGAGVPIHACPAGTERDPSGSLCYPSCKSLPAAAADIAANPSIDFTAVGPVCWTKCPPGFTDTGVGCNKPASYGRGAGRVPDVTCPAGWNVRGVGTASWCDRYVFPTLSTQKSSFSCRADEELVGGLCYPKCKPGFHAVGCCVCSPDCPPGFVDSGVSCTKKSYPRGVGVPLGCGPGEELDGGLCYPPCASVPAVQSAMKSTGKTFKGVGPACWQQ